MPKGHVLNEIRYIQIIPTILGSIVNVIRRGGGVYSLLMRAKILSLIVNQTFIWGLKNYEGECYVHDMDLLIISHYLKVFHDLSFMLPNYDFHMEFE